MTDEEETHYEVVGVDPSASKDEIRDTYRARMDELAEGKQSDESRRQMARLSSAWQVLSDPFQRERYDRGIGIDSDAAGVAADVEPGEADGEVEEAAAPARGARARDGGKAKPEPGARVGLLSTEPEAAPPTWPPGINPPPPRARVIAMVIDLLVLVAMVLAVQSIGGRVIDSVYEEETDRIDTLNDQIDELDEQQDRAEDRADEAQDDAERAQRRDDPTAEEQARQRARDERAAADAAENEADDEQEEVDDLQNDLVPAQLGVTGAILVLALLYLVPSSVVSGRTLGKQLMRIRVVHTDGTKLGVRSALLHYGVPVLAGLALLPILGPLVVGIVVLGVLTWPRNPNRQGLHDRLAGTLVVDG